MTPFNLAGSRLSIKNRGLADPVKSSSCQIMSHVQTQCVIYLVPVGNNKIEVLHSLNEEYRGVSSELPNCSVSCDKSRSNT